MARYLLMAMLLGVYSGTVHAKITADAVVDAAFRGGSAVSQNVAPVFTTITAALEAAPADQALPYRVFIKKGVYHEKLTVFRAGVNLSGESREETVISWGDSGSSRGPDGEELGTAGSATLTVLAPDFRAQNLTIENSFDYPANRALPENDPGRVEKMQAVTVRTTGDSDRAVFDSVTISGYQDTLFVDAGRHYFRNCRILGHVDFIFGAGQAVFDDCEIVSRNRAGKNPTGYITAPSTRVGQPYGFLFTESRLTREVADIPAASVRLGRPWHPNADPLANGSAVFKSCYMDDHIGPEGFAPISGRGPDGERIWFEVNDSSRFFEFGSHGPGAEGAEHRRLLTEEQAEWYTTRQVLNGWVPPQPD